MIVIFLICALVGFLIGWQISEYDKSSAETMQKINEFKRKIDNASTFNHLMGLQIEITQFLSDNHSMSRRQLKKLKEVVNLLATKTKTL